MGQELVDRGVAKVAERQCGVVSTAQLLGLGLSDKQIGWCVRRGWLHRLHRGVYAVGHRRLTAEGRWHAAVLACGDRAALSHRAAAAAWDLRAWGGGTIDVTVLTPGGRATHLGVRVHRRPGVEVTSRDGLRLTTVERTLLDLAPQLRPRELERALEQAQHRRLVDHGALAELARRPAAGAAKLRSLLAEPLTFTRSELERTFLELVDAANLPRPLTNHRIGPYECDFVWPAQRLIVETDGAEHHHTRHAFEHDRAKDAELTRQGWRVVRLTHRRLRDDRAGVGRLLSELLG